MKAKIEVLDFGPIENFLELNSVFEKVFGTERKKKPDMRHARFLFGGENFIVIAARVGDKIVGGLSIFLIDQYVVDSPSAYIHDLAVLEEYRGNGIGKKLMAFTVKYCSKLKFKDVFVLVEKENTDALAFFRSTLPKVEKEVIQFSYSL